MLTCCAICGGALPLALPCLEVHPDHCHDCHQRNLAQGCDAREHRPPVPRALVLTPRDVAALRVYQRHVARQGEGDTPHG